jgi:hypothetical protein
MKTTQNCLLSFSPGAAGGHGLKSPGMKMRALRRSTVIVTKPGFFRLLHSFLQFPALFPFGKK